VSGPIILAAAGGWRLAAGGGLVAGEIAWIKQGGMPDGVALYTCRRFED